MTAEQEQANEAQRAVTWREFSEAANEAAAGRFELARAYVARYPTGAAEFRAYVKWLKDGKPKKAKADFIANPAKESLGRI